MTLITAFLLSILAIIGAFAGNNFAQQSAIPTNGPILKYSTFIGGDHHDYAKDVAIDDAGCAYITGTTYSVKFGDDNKNFPLTPGSYQDAHVFNSSDVIITRLNSAGTSLLYSTVIRGEKLYDIGETISIDRYGGVCVGGYSASSDYPQIPNILNDSTYAEFITLYFATKLNIEKNKLLFSSFLPGHPSLMSLDSRGNLYIAFYTEAPNLPATTGAIGQNNAGKRDIYLMKFDPEGTELLYATYIGGLGNDHVHKMTLDREDNIYLYGSSNSNDFPVTDGAYTQKTKDSTDSYIMKVDAEKKSIIFSTFLGIYKLGVYPSHLAIDDSGSIYVGGSTTSVEFSTTPGAFDSTYNGGARDLFVMKFNSAGAKLEYATLIGGNGDDACNDIAVDKYGNVYLTGSTDSKDFPTTVGAFSTTNKGEQDAFLVRLDHRGQQLDYSTYLGGEYADIAWGIACNRNAEAVITGETLSWNFPTTTGAFDERLHQLKDVFVAKFLFENTTVGIGSNLDGDQATPKDFRLFQNYPNPFNPTTTLRYSIPKSTNVIIKIYDILGREIKILVNRRVSSGEYTVQWDGTDNFGKQVSSGIYIYRMATQNGIVQAKKMVLIR